MTIIRISSHHPTPLGPAPVSLEAKVTDGHAHVEVQMPRGSRGLGWDTKAAGMQLEAEVMHKMATLLAECLADEIRAHAAVRDQLK